MKRLFPLVFVLVTSTAQSEILKVKIDGIIDPITSEFISGAIGQAGQDKVEFLLIELSTPGGLGVSMQEIIQNILNSEIPIVCYVEPKGARAASAGFFVLLSADVAAMAPGTNTGAAHPVFPFGMENEKLLEKVTNDALASLRAIVKQRKRNYELAEKGVLESKSYTAREALEGGLIDLISENEEELLKELHGKEITRFSGEIQKISTEGQQVKLLEMTLRQKILSTIADPNLALILGVAGLLGLYLEFTSPGLLVPGVLGGICLLLSLLGFSLLPISLVGVLLIVLALGLFIAELKVQGFGLFGIGGIVAMTFGLLLLIDAPNPEVRIHKGFAFAVAISFGIILVFLLRLVIRSHMAKVITGTGSLEGVIGEARTQIDQEGGKVFIKGEWWQAVCEEPVAAGSKVRVLGAKDLVLTVEPCSRSNAKSSK
ncbi:nodulation protein NfeD [Acidobacteria bacterium AH-259-A15]|nr:nodulation protein NfeD [Acidobacteria bacterium AH-259-A15]